MSRATTRAALTAFLQPPAVTGLNVVFSATPKVLNGTLFRQGQAPGTKTGIAGVVHLVGETERRIAIGGATSGKKRVDYDVVVQVYCHSLELRSEDAMASFDTMMDALKDRIRADRTLASGDVFQAGEEMQGEYGDPAVLQDGATEIWGALRFTVTEILTS